MPGYRLSKAAQADLKALKNYIRTVWGDQQTQDYLAEIKHSLEKLLTAPALGKKRDEIIDGLRSFGVGRRIIFYRLSNTGIEVARILHSRMDIFKNVEPTNFS